MVVLSDAQRQSDKLVSDRIELGANEKKNHCSESKVTNGVFCFAELLLILGLDL